VIAVTRALVEEVFRAAVAACDPARRVREAIEEPAVRALLARGARRFGLAAGKAAIAMASGAGEVAEGLVIVPAGGGGGSRRVPAGWAVVESAHPLPDERSVLAARAARALVGRAGADDVVLALISGGTSALLEEPRDGITLDELRETTRRVMAAGAPIAELNRVRASLSSVKAGGLVRACAAPVVTLAVSDVIGDAIEVIGSGPTIAGPLRARDVARVISPMIGFARAAHAELARRGIVAELVEEPLAGDVGDVADLLARATGPRVAWGEPTLQVPEDHGEGGRAQQLALALARHLRGQTRSALVVGSDGIDGPAPAGRPAPAGAYVDGATWEAIARAGGDPARALARCDAGPALERAGALVITGATGINHADLVILL